MRLSQMGFVLLFFGILLCDQGTKLWSEKFFLHYSSPQEIHSYFAQSRQIFHIGQETWLDFSLTYVRNTGAAWGLFGNLPEWIRPYFFYVITALAMGFILVLFFKTPVQERLTRLGIAFIFSGAMGNYIDRLWLHYVIDWIHFQWKIFGWQYDYPVFNIADSFVTTGVILLLIDTLRSGPKVTMTSETKIT